MSFSAQLCTLSLFPEEAGDVRRMIEEEHQRVEKMAKIVSLVGWEKTAMEEELTQTREILLQEEELEDPHLEEENVVDGNNYEWTIIKTLFKSDVNSSSRLLLGKVEIETHIVPYLNHEEQDSLLLGSPQGIGIQMFDVERQQAFTLTLKKWNSTGSFVFTGHWRKDFVRPRGLVQDDQIGLYFDPQNRRLCFRLLRKAPHAPPAPAVA
ncbi:putative B3 domain-containing protein At1g78640 [Impatiens glandulifera]|uniref:putative B3 domain-containing protein At1g78640 n=1 Tax=Impatiens glandulifera TaxID=253017 RepID=UPI001FB15051|nr:putative B3 domain-containing protein At1g78640 [Impatiens glandulifera]